MNEDVIYFDDKVIVQTTVTNMCSVTRSGHFLKVLMMAIFYQKQHT